MIATIRRQKERVGKLFSVNRPQGLLDAERRKHILASLLFTPRKPLVSVHRIAFILRDVIEPVVALRNAKTDDQAQILKGGDGL